jgi:hypothetical protein
MFSNGTKQCGKTKTMQHFFKAIFVFSILLMNSEVRSINNLWCVAYPRILKSENTTPSTTDENDDNHLTVIISLPVDKDVYNCLEVITSPTADENDHSYLIEYPEKRQTTKKEYLLEHTAWAYRLDTKNMSSDSLQKYVICTAIVDTCLGKEKHNERCKNYPIAAISCCFSPGSKGLRVYYATKDDEIAWKTNGGKAHANRESCIPAYIENEGNMLNFFICGQIFFKGILQYFKDKPEQNNFLRNLPISNQNAVVGYPINKLKKEFNSIKDKARAQWIQYNLDNLSFV